MCGRYTHRQIWRQIHDNYRITEPEIGPGEPEPEIKPRYNMAPTQTALQHVAVESAGITVVAADDAGLDGLNLGR